MAVDADLSAVVLVVGVVNVAIGVENTVDEIKDTILDGLFVGITLGCNVTPIQS